MILIKYITVGEKEEEKRGKEKELAVYLYLKQALPFRHILE